MSHHRRTTIVGLGLVLAAGCTSLSSGNDDDEDWYLVGIPYDSSPNGAETTSADDPKLDDIDAVQMLVDDALDSSQRSNRRIASDERDLVEDRLESLPVYEGDDEYVRGTYVTRDSEAVALFLERED